MFLRCCRMILCLWIMCVLTIFAGDNFLVLCHFPFSANNMKARIALVNSIGKHVSTFNFCIFYLQIIDYLSFKKNLENQKTFTASKMYYVSILGLHGYGGTKDLVPPLLSIGSSRHSANFLIFEFFEFF